MLKLGDKIEDVHSHMMTAVEEMRVKTGYTGEAHAVSVLPPGRRFVDLFAGGCAMTHAAILSGKYERFIANDLHGFGLRLFRDAIAGKCNGRWREWVTREDFPVFVSEYTAPEGFTSIWSRPKKSIMNHFKDGHYGERTECLFVQDRFAEQFKTELF